jgi:mono/diheme cytochrome c family protein
MPRLLLGLCAALVALAAAGEPLQAPDRDSARNYVLRCMGCHGAEGGGVPPKIPSLRRSLPLFASLPEGREYLMRVPGASNSALSDAQLAGVLNYLAQRYADERTAARLAPFSAQEVAAKRRPALSDVASARRAVLARLAESGVTLAEDY